MPCERLRLTGDPGPFAAQLRALVPAPASVSAAVAEIIAGVRTGGDRALAATPPGLTPAAPSRRCWSAATRSTAPSTASTPPSARG